MGIYRNSLPQLEGDFFLTDGGLETTLVFHHSIDLPEFAAFILLDKERRIQQNIDRNILYDYFSTYAVIAQKNKVGFILESVTWRANSDWAKKIGYSSEQLAEFNRQSIKILELLRANYKNESSKFVISGTIGPRGDGYDPGHIMGIEEAEKYHSTQIDIFRQTNADMISAMTINNSEEAIGITMAAQKARMPVVISFTVGTNGKLPTGQSLKNAIEMVDTATNNGPAYYGLNCAHPTHIDHRLTADGDWMNRVRALRANASMKSHEELDNSKKLDEGNPQELGRQYKALKEKFKKLNVFGGCCGTNHRHIEEICKSVL